MKRRYDGDQSKNLKSMVCRVFQFSRTVNALKKYEKNTKNAEFNGDLGFKI